MMRILSYQLLVWISAFQIFAAEPAETIKWFRVQGGEGNQCSKIKVQVKPNNSIITMPREAICYSRSTPEHALYFLSNNRGSSAYIVEFDVPKWADDLFMECAEGPLGNSDKVLFRRVDIGKPGCSIEVHGSTSKWIQEVAIPGSARIVHSDKIFSTYGKYPLRIVNNEIWHPTPECLKTLSNNGCASPSTAPAGTSVSPGAAAAPRVAATGKCGGGSPMGGNAQVIAGVAIELGRKLALQKMHESLKCVRDNSPYNQGPTDVDQSAKDLQKLGFVRPYDVERYRQALQGAERLRRQGIIVPASETSPILENLPEDQAAPPPPRHYDPLDLE